jgi:TonB-linked SusC/RagA family outer membrane protein
VDISAKEEKVANILTRLFDESEVNILIRDRHIVLTPVEEIVHQQNTVSGKVTDNKGQPLPGVTVVVKGTTAGTITDNRGGYFISGIPENAFLLFSFVGMKSQEVAVGDRTAIDVVMVEESIGIDEVVAIGYGTIKKKDLTGAVSQINAAKMEAEATSNMTDILRGNIPGLNVNFNLSAKGLSNAESLEIRGTTSLTSNAPLIVLDGMIYSGDLSDINPLDIDRYDILKDASSAAIYGSRATNGVIIITTKKGKLGKPVINVSGSVGIATLSGVELDPMKGEQFINWRIAGFESNERFQVSKGAGYYSNYNNLPGGITLDTWKAYDGSTANNDLDEIWLTRIGFSPVEITNYKEGKTLNWKDFEYQTGLRQDYNLSISGSSDAITYYWSLGYTKNEGIIKNEEFNTVRTRINMEAKIADWLKVGSNTQLSLRDESSVTSGTNLNNVTPYSSFYENDGTTIKYAPTGNASISAHPWLAMVYENRLWKYNSLNSKIYALLDLPYGFTFTTEYIPRITWDREFDHFSSEHPDWGKKGGMASRMNVNRFEYELNNILRWNKEIDKHLLDFTFVYTAEKKQYWSDYMYGDQYQPNDILGYHRMQASTANIAISSDDTYSTADGLLTRLYYSLMGKYMATGSFRRDGFSAFGQSNPRANFGSLAFAWMLNKEGFFDIPWVNLLKLRLSYGINGNRGVGTYDALSILSTGKYVFFENATAQYTSLLYTSRMANSKLRWERTGAYNAGIDFSILDGRISGNMELYYMKTTDLLIPRLLPDVTGYSSVFSNLGQIDNRGIELVLNSVNISTKDFSWNTNFSFSHNRNEIVHLYGDMAEDENGNLREVNDIANEWFIGHALDQIWDYKVLGIWQENEQEQAAVYSRLPGDFKLEDVNGDGYFTNDDKQFQGYKKPRYRLSLHNDLRFKNWNFSVKMYSYLGYFSANNHKKNFDGFYDRINSYNVPYWTPENPNNEWARIGSFPSGFNIWENNSLIRIDNIALSYRIPQNLMEKIKLQSCRISLIAENPLVWSPGWNWMDPEKYGFTSSFFTMKLNFTL